MPPTSQTTRREIVSALQRDIGKLDNTQPDLYQQVISSGCSQLDELLPTRGLRRGRLVEWLSSRHGSGAATLSLWWAQRVQAAGGRLVILDCQQQFYPPAAAALGIDLERLIVVTPQNQQDLFWTWHQVLQCRAVAAAWGWIHELDNRTFRRWQLAAEASGTIGFLLRPDVVRGQPSWAELQFQVTPCSANQGRGLQVELVRCRGATTGGKVALQLDERAKSLVAGC